MSTKRITYCDSCNHQLQRIIKVALREMKLNCPGAYDEVYIDLCPDCLDDLAHDVLQYGTPDEKLLKRYGRYR